MKTTERKTSYLGAKVVFIILALFMMFNTGWAQDHDLVMTPAADFTSSTAADKKSPDLKIGADFGDTSVTDIVRRGIPNDIFARFYINGMQDHTIPSGSVEVKFYWRTAASSTDIPPALGTPTWNYIDKLNVTYIPSDGPFTVTRVWPTDFPSVTTKSVSWTPPPTGDYFHVAAEAVYPSSITDANPVDNVAISLYGSQSGLLDIVLVLDASGSMGTFTYAGSSYMAHAIARTNAFLALLDPYHRFSVVAYDGDYPGGDKDIWPTTPPPLRPATTANVTLATPAVSGLTPGGMTPMGQGIERAIQILTTAPGPVRKRVLLLLSDGYENWGTPRACPPGYPTGTCVGAGLSTQLQTANIRVFSIALGTAAWTTCLQCLSDETGGERFTALGAGLDLAEVYKDIQQAFTADDLYRMDRGTSGGGDDTYSTYFEGKDNLLYFSLEWEDLKAELDLKLTPPSPSGRIRKDVFRGKGYVVIRVNNPTKGTWKYEVTGETGKAYLTAVRSNRVNVRLGLDILSEKVVGSGIEIQARLLSGKRPITNARLTATVQVPVGHSLNTIVRNAYRKHILRYQKPPVDPGVFKKYPDISSRAIFIQKLTGDTQKPLVQTETITVPLRHVGKGYYTGVLKGNHTTTAGQYTVTVKGTGRGYQRVFSKQVQLRPGALDYKKSFGEIVMMKSEVEEPVYLLRVYAADKFGNAITYPSLAERVKSDVKGAELYRKPSITFGAMERVLTVSPRKKPILERVRIDGNHVKVIKNGETQ